MLLSLFFIVCTCIFDHLSEPFLEHVFVFRIFNFGDIFDGASSDHFVLVLSRGRHNFFVFFRVYLILLDEVEQDFFPPVGSNECVLVIFVFGK